MYADTCRNKAVLRIIAVSEADTNSSYISSDHSSIAVLTATT